MVDLETLKALDSAASPRGWQPVLLNDLSDVTYIEGTPLGHPAGKQAASWPDGHGGWTDGFADPGLQEQIHADARLICAARDSLSALVEVAEAAQALAVCIVPAVGGFPMIAPNSGAQVLRLEEALSEFSTSGGHGG